MYNVKEDIKVLSFREWREEFVKIKFNPHKPETSVESFDDVLTIIPNREDVTSCDLLKLYQDNFDMIQSLYKIWSK